MLFRWLELENIRSYVRERIEFPAGSTLLSGDVGCGKSTVLLASEFALFGIQRGELGGSDLLRHGSNDGSVRLCFEVDGREIVICRNLKRDKKSVSQESGWIQLSGIRHSKTASELRAIVLELLGYPMEYQTKNPIVFRYTVYTPQDEMKRILFASPDERIGILRKIFQIDKYGRIRANAETVAIKELRAMKRELDSASADLEVKQSDAETKRTQLELLGVELKQSIFAAESAGRAVAERAIDVEKISQQIRALSKLAQSAATKESIVRERKLRNQKISSELEDLQKKIVMLEKMLDTKPNALEFSEQELTVKKRELELRRSSIIAHCSLLDSEAKRYKTILEKGHCEFCGQDVADRQAFSGRMHSNYKEAELEKLEAVQITQELALIERRQREISEYSYKVKIYDNSMRDLVEKRTRAQDISDERTRNERDVAEAETELVQLRSELGKLSELETLERGAKSELSKLQTSKSDIDRTLARTESQIESTTRELGRLEKEIADKQSMRSRIVRFSTSIAWLEQTFVPLMQAMEHIVMATVQREFNAVFQSWFAMLMGGESLSVEADDQFAPVITQEGYQTEYQNLSGGEKTAVALAYRLALNKSINALIENIKTKDLIILDEPTDGFSSEQIDRIRDVLGELKLRQTILVSHEPKIDTFVEHVIRFHKEGHTSRVLKAA